MDGSSWNCHEYGSNGAYWSSGSHRLDRTCGNCHEYGSNGSYWIYGLHRVDRTCGNCHEYGCYGAYRNMWSYGSNWSDRLYWVFRRHR